ncbi:MAG: hypothetical protein Q4B04_04290, partial [bacterium]|nr:hypothetical protein [bacterium]
MKRLLLFLIDVVIVSVSFFSTAFFVFDFRFGNTQQSTNQLLGMCLLILAVFISRFSMNFYKNIWRYSSARVYLNIILCDILGTASFVVITGFFARYYIGIIMSFALISVSILATIISRLFYQQFRYFLYREPNGANVINIAIVGAGELGAFLADELLESKKSHYRPYCFIDNDKRKVGSRICGIKVIAEDDEICKKLSVMPVEEIVIAIGNLTGDKKQEIFDRYKQTGCKLKLYDYPLESGPLDETSSNLGEKRTLREVNIEDLLF